MSLEGILRGCRIECRGVPGVMTTSQSCACEGLPVNPEERTQHVNAALDTMGDGLSREELENMLAAMTDEYAHS